MQQHSILNIGITVNFILYNWIPVDGIVFDYVPLWVWSIWIQYNLILMIPYIMEWMHSIH